MTARTEKSSADVGTSQPTMRKQCCKAVLAAIWSYNSATGHFVWLVRSPGTVYHWTFVRHRHYQR